MLQSRNQQRVTVDDALDRVTESARRRRPFARRAQLRHALGNGVQFGRKALGLRVGGEQRVKHLAAAKGRAGLVGDHTCQHPDALDAPGVDASRHDSHGLGCPNVRIRVDAVIGRVAAIAIEIVLTLKEDLSGEEVAEQLAAAGNDRHRAVPQAVPTVKNRRAVTRGGQTHPSAIAVEALVARSRGASEVLTEGDAMGYLIDVVALVIEHDCGNVKRDCECILNSLQTVLPDQLDERPRRNDRGLPGDRSPPLPRTSSAFASSDTKHGAEAVEVAVISAQLAGSPEMEAPTHTSAWWAAPGSRDRRSTTAAHDLCCLEAWHEKTAPAGP